MIGPGLKKLAENYGMKIDRGVAYGELCGFAATFCEGSGWKRILFATAFPDKAQQRQLEQQLDMKTLNREYRVRDIHFDSAYIAVTFNDTIGTMKRITAFIDLFIPLLRSHGALSANICAVCGKPVESDCWKLLDGAAYPMHAHCANGLSDDLERSRAAQQDRGSYLRGLAGALLGAALGSVVWAVIYLLGYIASAAGLLIGFLAEKGYEKLGGKHGKGKIPILIIAIVFGVVLGMALDYVAVPAIMILTGELSGNAWTYFPDVFRYMFENTELISAFARDCAIGLFYAFLGAGGSLIATGKSLRRKKVEDLK